VIEQRVARLQQRYHNGNKCKGSRNLKWNLKWINTRNKPKKKM